MTSSVLKNIFISTSVKLSPIIENNDRDKNVNKICFFEMLLPKIKFQAVADMHSYVFTC